MEREEIIKDLHMQIESMARLHVRHGLYDSEGFRRRREHVRKLIRDNNVDVRRELDPVLS